MAGHGSPTNVLLIADTHLGAGRSDLLLARLGDVLDGVDLVVHAGDITHVDVLDGLARAAPDARVLAVRGNNDSGVDLPERLEVDVAGCRLAAIHDSGPARGRRQRLRRWFPTADLVVFGHSHLPWHETDADADGHVQHHVNPGSAVQRRRAPTCTVARVVIADGTVAEVRHVPVGGPATGI